MCYTLNRFVFTPRLAVFSWFAFAFDLFRSFISTFSSLSTRVVFVQRTKFSRPPYDLIVRPNLTVVSFHVRISYDFTLRPCNWCTIILHRIPVLIDCMAVRGGVFHTVRRVEYTSLRIDCASRTFVRSPRRFVDAVLLNLPRRCFSSVHRDESAATRAFSALTKRKTKPFKIHDTQRTYAESKTFWPCRSSQYYSAQGRR